MGIFTKLHVWVICVFSAVWYTLEGHKYRIAVCDPVHHESVGITFDNTVKLFLRHFTVDTVRYKLPNSLQILTAVVQCITESLNSAATVVSIS